MKYVHGQQKRRREQNVAMLARKTVLKQRSCQERRDRRADPAEADIILSVLTRLLARGGPARSMMDWVAGE